MIFKEDVKWVTDVYLIIEGNAEMDRNIIVCTFENFKSLFFDLSSSQWVLKRFIVFKNLWFL